MRIMIRDGRVFEGTPLEIVRRMQKSAVLAPIAVAEYIDWVAANTFTSKGIALSLSGGSDAQRAASLLREMLAHGLAVEESVDA